MVIYRRNNCEGEKMSNSNSILLSSTSSLEGLKIEKYIDFISAQVVAGTGLFSDIVASFTDVFGGSSGEYEKQLDRLNMKAIDSLKVKARRLGANAVIGLRIDYDEISGKGMMMFMATASGTAVRISVGVDKFTSRAIGRIGVDELKSILFKEEILHAMEKKPCVFTTEAWNFIVENQIQEVIPYIFEAITNPLEKLNIRPDYAPEKFEEFKRNANNLFANLPEDDAMRWLYSGLDQQEKVALFSLDVIKKNNLLSIEKMAERLKSDKPEIGRFALKLVECEKQYYENDDIEKLTQLIGLIEDNFRPAELTTQDKGLLAKGKESWRCECGRTNPISSLRCDCGRDRYGFMSGQMDSLKAISILNQKINALKTVFVNVTYG